jgi:ABC-type uncharacterized transport system involved in gliding motility auxiliary subunit
MIASPRARFALLIQNGLFVALLVAAVLLLARLSQEHFRQWDLTQNARNSLSTGSVQTLDLLKGPVTITAFATEQDPTLGDIRQRIVDFMAPYRQAKSDLSIEFVDPRADPKRTELANVRMNGEMVVAFAGRSEHLTALDEQTFANLLARLARNAERQVFFLDGHGERSPKGIANHDLGEFGRRLEAKGFRLNLINLGVTPGVPDNASMLVIAGPRVGLLPEETAKIRTYVDRGGSLLWLIDQEPLHGLQPLADFLGLQLGPGIVVDPAANELRGAGPVAIAFAYGRHPATRNFALNTAFPNARRIAVNDDGKAWRVTPLVEVAQQGWVEMGPLDSEVSFDKARDIRGPVTVVSALERDIEGRTQRVIVTGSGDFLANTYAGLLGNVDLGISLVNWLAGDENLITLEPRSRVDTNLELSRSWLTFIALVFLIGLPGAFLFTGGMIWWRRRRA